MVIRATNPLYGISKPWLYWSSSYDNQHVENLGTKKLQIDFCFLFQKSRFAWGGSESLGRWQRDFRVFKLPENSRSGIDRVFVQAKEAIGSEATLIQGVKLRILPDGTVSMIQSGKIGCLSIPMTGDGTRGKSALAQYIGINCRRDVCAWLCWLRLESWRLEKHTLNRYARQLTISMKQCMPDVHFLKLHLGSALEAVLSDASFSNFVVMKGR